MNNIKETVQKNKAPVKILQFGEGNFLRAFVDYMVDVANKNGTYLGNVAIVQPINFPLMKFFAEQDSVYTVVLRGKENGEKIDALHTVTCVEEVFSAYDDYEHFMSYASLETLEAVVSNTTEAGIVFDETDSFELCPPNSYPGKLTKFLYARYEAFNGDKSKGLSVFPVELIENNGIKLRECVLKLAEKWALPAEFSVWVKETCMFCSTLVDRIVTGYPKVKSEAEKLTERLGATDNLLDICEPFALWVIEAPDADRARRTLPLDKAGLPVVFTDNQKPYRERKVRILNGAHTSFVPAAFLAGETIVRDCMANADIRAFIDRAIYSEIMPTVKLPQDDVKAFADSVCERFENPFVDHELISICLNSVSKWKARVLPSVLDSLDANGKLMPCITFSFASLCEFYSRGEMKNGEFVAERIVDGKSESYKISDDASVLEFFAENGKADDIITRFASNEAFWGRNLAEVDGFVRETDRYLKLIRENGVLEAMKTAVAESENV